MSVTSKRVTLGSRHPSKPRTEIKGSKVRDLLSEDKAAEAKNTVVNQVSVGSGEDDLEKYWKLFAVPACKYEYPREDKVPGGYYYAEIKNMELRFKKDQVILDVGYWFENYTGIYYVLQSYPAGSIPFKNLRAAIAAAGIDASTNIRKAIGMSEQVCLAYISKHSDIGSIIDRMPCEKLPDVDENGYEIVPETDQDDDSEFDDFLDTEE